MPTTLDLGAPSAVRTPISLRRRAIVCEVHDRLVRLTQIELFRGRHDADDLDRRA